MTFLTPQEVFAKGANHLLTQNRKSRRPSAYGSAAGNDCAYRGEDGAKCGVGCFIPDACYVPDMEGVGVGDLRSHYSEALIAGGINLDDSGVTDLLWSFQEIHDHRAVKEWAGALAELASKHGYSLEGTLLDA